MVTLNHGWETDMPYKGRSSPAHGRKHVMGLRNQSLSPIVNLGSLELAEVA